MSKYKVFFFESYEFDPKTKTLILTYSLDGRVTFVESYRFDFKFGQYDTVALDRALQLLFFMAGVSYYKTFIPPKIIINAGLMNANDAAFFSKTYQRGLGEFFYVNKLDPQTNINFPVTTQNATSQIYENSGKGMLIGLGGGKDSLVSVEVLKNLPDTSTWSVGHKSQLKPLTERTQLPHFWVERTWDKQLVDLNESGAYNGHVPISAILACVGVVVAVLSGKQDVVVSNENSANEPTLSYKDVEINHQYSKSLEFEKDFQAYLRRNFGESIRYYSFLRPLSELKISELFAKLGFQKYKDVFSSCNRAFTHNSDRLFWCGKCPKCAFVFLALTPFISRHELEELFDGKNLLLDNKLQGLYENLLGISGDKPLECVGEVKESRAAMRLATKTHSELNKYEFDIPNNYDYRTLAPHSMPKDIYDLLNSVL